MRNAVWLFVLVLTVLGLFALNHVFSLGYSIIWVILIVAIVLAVIAVLTGGYGDR